MSNIKPDLIKPNDYRKLKDSHPVKIIAHSHECIVPVVYSSMVNNFLKSKGINLPLSHHELAKLKEKAKEFKGGPQPDKTKTTDDLYNAKGSSNLSINIKGKGSDVLKILQPTKRRRVRGRIVKTKQPIGIKGQIDASRIWQAGTPANALKGWTTTLLSATPNPPKDIDKELERQEKRHNENLQKIREEQEQKSKKYIEELLERDRIRQEMKTPIGGNPIPTIRPDPTTSSSSYIETYDNETSSEEEPTETSVAPGKPSQAAPPPSESEEEDYIPISKSNIIDTKLTIGKKHIYIINETIKYKDGDTYKNYSTAKPKQTTLDDLYTKLDEKNIIYKKFSEQERGKKGEPGKKR